MDITWKISLDRMKNRIFIYFSSLLFICSIFTIFWIWFEYNYALNPIELFNLYRKNLPILSGLEFLPGYADYENLPDYLNQRKDTVTRIRDIMSQENFGMYDLVRLGKCESSLNPNAYNKSSGATGLFQFKVTTWNTTPYCSGDIWGIEDQTKATIWMFRHSRHREWECFKSSLYKRTETPARPVYLKECR